MTKKNTKNLIHKSLIIIVLVLMLLTVFAPVLSVCAEEADYSLFEKSNVIDDLKSVDGFDFSKYPKNSNGSFQLINVVEYCYSENPEVNMFYGLYLYCYNPTCFNVLPLGNSVQLATKFNDDGSGASYEKFKLELLSTSEANDKNLFLKFRVLDIEKLLSVFGSDARRYEISGIEINSKPEIGTARLVDYSVGGYWHYTGFSKGCGSDPQAESTLDCVIRQTEVIELRVHDSVYRTGENSNGQGHRTQVNSVAFALPNRFLRDYGELQRIEAEWYQFRTNPIIVTANEEIYNSVYSVRDRDIVHDIAACNFQLYGSQTYYDSSVGVGSAREKVLWYYNYVEDHFSDLSSAKRITRIPNIFYANGVSDVSNYVLSSDILTEHIRNYPISGEEYYSIGSGRISSATVIPVIDENHATANRRVVIDAEKARFDLKAYVNSYPSAGELFWRYYGGKFVYPEVKDISPIYIIDEKAMKSTDTVISNELLWQADKVSWLKQFYRNSLSEDKSAVLFRFASTDYMSEILEVGKNDGYYFGKRGENIWAEQDIFLDFDILSLTFGKDGVFTVIPTVSSPIDIVGSIEPPFDLDKNSEPDNWLDKLLTDVSDFFAELWAKVKAFFSNGSNWWKWVLIGLAVLIGLPLVIALLPLIIKFVVALCKGLWYVVKYVSIGLWWLISAPFKLITKGVRAIREKRGV